MKKIIFILLMECICLHHVMAQSFYPPYRYPMASVFANNPVGANSAFAGSSGVARVYMQSFHEYFDYIKMFPAHRFPDQMSMTTATYTEYHSRIGYDNFIPKLSSGIGGSLSFYSAPSRDAGNSLNVISSSIFIAPKISIRGKYTLSPSVSFSYGYSDQNFKTLPDNYGSSVSLGGGFLFNSNRAHAGFTYGFFSARKRFTTGSESTLKLSVGTFHASYTFQKDEESRFSITPMIIIARNAPYDPFITISNFFINFRYKKLIGGVGENLMIGYQNSQIRLALTGGYFKKNYADDSGYHKRALIALSVRVLFKKQTPLSVQ